MLWNQYCIIRVAVVYLCRAVPLAWRVKKHNSSSITLKEYQALLKRVARLMPKGVKVILLGDRGFVDTKLMKYASQELRWHYRFRFKSDFWVWRPGKGWCQVRDFHLGRGQALLLQNVRITKIDPYGPVYLALAREGVSGELWYIVSDEPTTLQTFRVWLALRY